MSTKSSKKTDEKVTVISNTEIAPGFMRMKLASDKLAKKFKPGQFFQFKLSVDGTAPLLRRPFAPSGYEPGSFTFVYAVVGEGTEIMSRMKKGDQAAVLGPLGNGYSLCAKKGRAILVGGGCGTASLLPLAENLASRKVELYSVIGARTSCSLLEKKAFKKVSDKFMASTDDGSEGFKGNAVEAVRQILDKLKDGPAPVLYACGPTPMLKGLSLLAEEKGLECQVSLEERMACGFGACMGCAVAIKADNADGFVYKRVCHDGPVFSSTELKW